MALAVSLALALWLSASTTAPLELISRAIQPAPAPATVTAWSGLCGVDKAWVVAAAVPIGTAAPRATKPATRQALRSLWVRCDTDDMTTSPGRWSWAGASSAAVPLSSSRVPRGW